jgi:hypothetical protein
VVVLGVLVLLALLATSFHTVQSIERRVTHNYTDHVRAKLVAQSGVDSAVTRLWELARQGWFINGAVDRSWIYFGSQVDESADAEPQTPLEEARNPSFALEDEFPQNPSDGSTGPKQIRIEGNSVGLSGTVGGTYAANADLFLLKILDAQSMINVNDGVNWGPHHSVSQNLRRLLNVLGEQPEVAAWKSVPSDRLGDLIVGARPPKGYSSKLELLRLFGNDARRFNAVRDFLTAASWTNPSVANPVPLSAAALGAYPTEVSYARPLLGSDPIYRYGHGKNWMDQLISTPMAFYDPALADDLMNPPFYCAYWTTDALHPQWIELVARSPINVNTAALPVLSALLTDLEGFFTSSRRRPSPGDMFYTLMMARYSYDATWSSEEQFPSYYWSSGHPANSDEIGYITRTIPLTGPGSRWGSNFPGGLSAPALAKEIVACRERRRSAATGQDYATLPFGGPFRSWAQFHTFVDSLVAPGGLIWDSRPLFKDYLLDPATTQVLVVDSYVQRHYASQAAADSIKANFNPNLHLNELNPDRPLWLHVDKTDLIVHSTELCFVPMGRFEIQSLGYVLANDDPASGTTLAGSLGSIETQDNRIVARCLVHAAVKLYDADYYGVQSHFYPGEFSPRSGGPTTNNDRSIESGPEVDNGPAPLECHYDGWFCLPTQLGSGSKPKGALVTSYQGNDQYPGLARTDPESAEFSEKIHAHFQVDHSAGVHPGGAPATLTLGIRPNSGVLQRLVPPPDGIGPPVVSVSTEKALNYSDRTETRRGPYGPADSVHSATAHRYRLCRSFALPSLESVRASNPSLDRVPPPAGYEYARSDLRLDGTYSEPHSVAGYDLTSHPATNDLVAAFWYKPNFHPESTGRMRALFSMKFCTPWVVGQGESGRLIHELPFTAFWVPSPHGQNESDLPRYLEYPHRPARRNSIIWGVGWHAVGTEVRGGGVAALSTTLNHEFETAAPENGSRFFGAADGGKNDMRAHEWVHVVLSCQAQESKTVGSSRMQIHVNGRLVSGAADPDVKVHVEDVYENLSWIHGHSARMGGDFSQVQTDTNATFFADGTIDEFFMWIDQGILGSNGNALLIYRLGRYYRPNDADPDDARFTSAALTLGSTRRELPRGSVVSAPGETGSTGVQPPPAARPLYIMGVNWTCWAEDYTAGSEPGGLPRLKPVMYDHRGNGAPVAFSPANSADASGYSSETVCEMSLKVGARICGPYRNEGWSPVWEAADSSEEVRYSAKLRVGPIDRLNAVLLATPVLDDLTLFTTAGAGEFLSYAEEK